MRAIIPFSLLVLVPATARGDVDHVVELGYQAAAAGSSDGVVEVAAGGDASETMTYDDRLQLAVSAGADLRHVDGAARATGAATRARIAVGPAPLPLGNEDRGRIAWLPATWEVEHEGDLAALPRLGDRADVRREPYAWQRVAGATRLVRVEVADDGCASTDPDCEHPEDRSAGALDVFPLALSVATTAQGDDRRVDASFTGAMLGMVVREPFAGELLVGGLEQRASRLGDGRVMTLDIIWALRLTTSPSPRHQAFTIGWGHVVAADDGGPRPREVDHRSPPHLVEVGLGGGDGELGAGVQFRREPYLSLDGRWLLDDRAWVEAWFPAAGVDWRGRGFLARTSPLASEGPRHWTGGVELGADRRVGPVDLGLLAEAGQSFYAALDDAAPAPAFAARGALTVRRAANRRWFY